MSNKAKKYIVITLVLAFCISAFTFTAFAEESQQITKETTSGTASTSTPNTGNSSSSSSSSGGTSAPSKQGTGSSSSDGTGGGVTHESQSSTVTVVFNLSGGSGMRSSASVTKGTTVSEFKTPYKKGYKFVAWMVNGTEVSGSMPINSDTTLTAEWEKASDAASSQAANSVDTKQKEIEEAANQANQAASEPDTLSSEDWNSLLNSSGSSDVSSAVSSSQASSAAPASTGGFSTLLAIGIALIVLGVAGVGIFIYLQFIHNKGGKGGHGGSGGPGKHSSKDDTIVFTDVSSYSDGKKHDDSQVIRSVRQPNPAPKKSPVSDDTKPVPVPAAARPKPQTAAPAPAPKSTMAPEERRAQSEQNRYLKKAQAKPVDSDKSDFDWEKFFNEEK